MRTANTRTDSTRHIVRICRSAHVWAFAVGMHRFWGEGIHTLEEAHLEEAHWSKASSGVGQKPSAMGYIAVAYIDMVHIVMARIVTAWLWPS